MTDKVDYRRLFRGAAWALAGVCCVGVLFLGMTNCLPSATDNSSGGSGGGGNTSSGGDTGSSSSTDDSGGSGGTTYETTSTTATGGTTHATTSTTATGGTTHATTSTTATGGTTRATTTSSPPTGGSTTTPPTTTATGGTPPAGGSVGSTGGPPSGTTVTFLNGKAVGAMTGYGWVALGSLDSLSDPKCGTAAYTSTTNCAATTWSTTTSLCITGTVPALGATPDYTNNWGVSVGVNSTDPAGAGLGQSFTSVAITVTGSPTSGLRGMMHRKGDPDATSYCAALTSGTAMPLTSFTTTCYTPTTPGTALTAADVPNIDKISVQVSSGTAAVAVANLCITGITFAK